jgi:PAS domain S-box-containing protein
MNMDAEIFKRQLHILHLEDDEPDHLLMSAMLATGGLLCEIRLAKSKDEFAAALTGPPFDLIISDYSLPSYDGLSALKLARQAAPATPFVFFSGTIGEEVAVESLKHGAADYVLKQRPGRLVAAIRRALVDAAERQRLQTIEQALRQSEERLHIVAKATNDVIWEWNVRHNRVWCSENFATAYGHPVDGALDSERWFDFIHPDDKARVVASLHSLMAGGGQVWWSEHRLRRHNGSHAYIFDRASVIYDEARQPLRVVGVKIDVSERKQIGEKIREQAALLSKAQDAFVVCGLDWRIEFWNAGAERIYGCAATEAMGKNLQQLLFAGDPPPAAAEMTQSLTERGEWAGELEQVAHGGRSLTVRSRATVVRDDDGRPKSLLIVNTDITEHKQLEEQFLRAQRLESLGMLVSGIAHDLNNMLVPILFAVETLRDEPLSPMAEAMVHTMDTSARRSADMVRQMLVFARGGQASKQQMHPEHLLKEMGRVIADTFPKIIQRRVDLGRDLYPIHCVPTQIHQVLMNLCVNARDAMPEHGTLTLAAHNVTLSAADAAQMLRARAGRFLCISVADTGTGIAPEHLAKIFQPFFTTKGPGKGTGLGLSTCLGIIKKHDGFITVHSRPNAGTEFRVYLPAAEVKPAEPPPAIPLAPPEGNGEHILVVDDEQGILAMTRAALENYGYKVSTAANGLEAISLFRENAKAIQLVITDHNLPVLGARAMITALRKIQPAVRVILTSGGENGTDEDVEARGNGFLAKPFSPETLLKMAHDVLTASPDPEVRARPAAPNSSGLG